MLYGWVSLLTLTKLIGNRVYCGPNLYWTIIIGTTDARGGVEDTRLEAKDSLSEDRHSRGQGQECSRPRTQAQVLSKKKGLHKNFSGDLKKKKKKRFPKNFSSAPQNFNNSKNSAVLEPRTGQFSRIWDLEAKAKDLTFEAKAKDFKMCPRGLHLWPTLASHIPLFLLGHFPTNECKISDFCL